MKKMLLFFAMFILAGSLSVKADENSQNSSAPQLANGQVQSVDWVASRLAVSTGQGVVSVKTDERTVIKRGNDTISLSDIEISDQLEIEYVINQDGEPLAVRISDQNLGNN